MRNISQLDVKEYDIKLLHITSGMELIEYICQFKIKNMNSFIIVCINE